MSHATQLHVVFGVGQFGQATVRALSRRGHRVRLVNRGGRANKAASIEVIAADTTDSSA